MKSRNLSTLFTICLLSAFQSHSSENTLTNSTKVEVANLINSPSLNTLELLHTQKDQTGLVDEKKEKNNLVNKAALLSEDVKASLKNSFESAKSTLSDFKKERATQKELEKIAHSKKKKERELQAEEKKKEFASKFDQTKSKAFEKFDEFKTWLAKK